MKHGKRVLSLLLAVLLVAVIAPSAWAVSLTGTQVAEYCRSLEGGSYPSGYCLSFVADCFADLGAARDSACCAYTYGSSHITSTSMSNIPLGADVFFTGSGSTCSRCGNRCGHIGIYVGDGYMIHAMSGKVRLDLVTTIDSYSSLAFRGWGYHGNVTITGGEPAPRDQDARFNGLLPLKTYALSGSGQIPVYTSAGIQESGRWIDAAADECIIQAVYADGWCQVQYPSSASASGYRTAYVPLSTFTSASAAGFSSINATGSGPAYRRSSGSDTIGSVDKGDACRKLSEAGGRWQVVYPTPGGNKTGWCDPMLFSQVPPEPDPLNYGVPCAAYAIDKGHLTVYKEMNIGSAYPTSGSGCHYIDGESDKCTISAFYSNGWVRLSYPTGSGPFEAYAPLSYFIPGSAAPIQWTADTQRYTYRRSTGTEYVSETGGVSYVSAGDNCIQTAAENNRIQIQYSLDIGGYKLGWVDAAEKKGPAISNIQVTDQSADGYTVTCTVTDDTSVREVRFPTWTTKTGQDDIQPDWTTNPDAVGTRNGNKWSYRVNISDHSNETGEYNTHIYAYDVYGNSSSDGITVIVDGQKPVVSNVQVKDVTETGFTVTCTVTDNVGVTRVLFPTWTEKNGQDDLFQPWKTNPANEGAKSGGAWTFRVHTSAHNGEYGKYIVRIYAYDAAGNESNKYETSATIPVPVSDIYLDREELALTAGESAALSAAVEPADAADKTVTWTSSDTAVAAVSGGTVRAVAAGTAYITAATQNGLIAVCTVTVSSPAPAELESIAPATLPGKTAYRVGETLDPGGLTLTATYSDGSARTVTEGFTCSPTVLTAEGSQTVTVSYGGKTCAFTVTVLPESVSGGTIAVGSGSGKAGGMAAIPVVITGNPGIVAARLQLSWNGDAIALFDVQDGGLLGTYSFSQDLRSPYTVIWQNGTSAVNFDGEGTILTLTFRIPDGTAAGDYAIGISALPQEIYDKDMTPVSFTLQGGVLTVTEDAPARTPGDANGDGAVDTRDAVTVLRWFAGWDLPEAVEANMDCDGIPGIDSGDAIRILRWYVGWDVELY